MARKTFFLAPRRPDPHFYGSHTELFISNEPHPNDLTVWRKNCIKSPHILFNFLFVTLTREVKIGEGSQMAKERDARLSLNRGARRQRCTQHFYGYFLLNLRIVFPLFRQTMLHVAIAAPKNKTLAGKKWRGKKRENPEMAALWQLHQKRAQLLQINQQRRWLIGKTPFVFPFAPFPQKKLTACKTGS